MEIRTCKTCQQDKPVSEFYPRGGGLYFRECKNCYRQHANVKKTSVSRAEPYHPTEQIVLDKLHSLGIAAVPGKAIASFYADIVAWGLVNIEVKYSQQTGNDGRCFHFHMTPAQKKRGFVADLVILVCDYGAKHTFHVFLPTHEAFYKQGELKKHMAYTPNASLRTRRHNTYTSLTDAMMTKQQDRWDMIEATRIEKSRKLIR